MINKIDKNRYAGSVFRLVLRQNSSDVEIQQKFLNSYFFTYNKIYSLFCFLFLRVHPF